MCREQNNFIGLRNCVAIMYSCASTMRNENSNLMLQQLELKIRILSLVFTCAIVLRTWLQQILWQILYKTTYEIISVAQKFRKIRIIFFVFFLQVFDERRFRHILTLSKILILFWPINAIKNNYGTTRTNFSTSLIM